MMTQSKVTQKEADQANRECIADKLRLLSRVITKLYDDAFRPLGMTTSQMNILVVITKFGTASPGRVGDWLHMEKSTLSRNVDRMRKHGWLGIIPGKHGRSHQLKLTAKGMEILEQGLPLWKQAQKKAQSVIGNRGIEEMMRMGNRVRLQQIEK